MTTLGRLQELAADLPPVPGPDLDPYLDAAARCFERYGITRTAVPDVARELGVSRSTVYRRVGSVEELSRMLFSRELHRLVMAVEASLARPPGPDAIIGTLATIASFAREHPVMRKVLADEPEVIGPFLVRQFAEVVNRIASMLAPILRAAMREGRIASRDPAILAEWLIRITVSLVIAPPPVEVRRFIREVILPVLDPEHSG